MSLSSRTLGRFCTLIALVALTAPTHAAFRCHCGERGCRVAKSSPSKSVKSCCKCKSHAKDAAPVSSKDSPSDSHSSGCPGNCPSPCSLGQPSFDLSAHGAADFLQVRPIGLIALQSSQRPAAPALDGLLRPPRA